MAADSPADLPPSRAVEIAGPLPATGDGPGPSEPAMEAALFFARLSRRRPLVTYLLLLAIGGIFGLEQLWGGGSLATLVRMGAEVPSRVRSGEWWRLLAPTLLHSGLPHVAMNGFVLWRLGPFVERLLGSARFLSLYVLCGLLGSVFGTLFAGLSKFTLSVGASGALFGLLGATLVLGLWPRGQLPQLLVKDLKKSALLNLGLNVAVSLAPHVDYLAHLGGALAGCLLVGLGPLRPTVNLRRPVESRRSRQLSLVLAWLCGLLLCGSFGLALRSGQPWLLIQPLTFIRQPIGATGLSLEVPTLLAAGELLQRESGATELNFGNALDFPAVLSVVVYPLGVTAVDLAEPTGATRLGPTTMLDVAGQPAQLDRYRYNKSGLLLERIFQVRGERALAVESFSPADLAPNLRLDVAQILDSLRSDSGRQSVHGGRDGQETRP